MEVSALRHSGAAGLHGRSPLLRLQSDERLVALARRGNQGAFETLVARYQARLLAFCRHMLSSKEDAEDVLQEVFAASFNAMLADERPINVRPWLYRIARNRCLNHLRKATAIGVDSMDVHLSDHGETTADQVHKREEFRLLVGDVQDLPETQRTALLLREIDALSYEQIAEAMDTTVPSVKSLLVRARVSLAEMAEARLLSCDEVRLELGEVAEGLRRTSAPVRRHLRTCDRCSAFRTQLRNTNKALAALYPIGPLLILKKVFFAHLGTTAAAGGGTAAAGGAASAAGAAASGAALQAGMSAVATKAAATLAAAAIVTAGAVEVKHVTVDRERQAPATVAQLPPATPPAGRAATAPVSVAQAPQPDAARPATEEPAEKSAATPDPSAPALPAKATPEAPAAVTAPALVGEIGGKVQRETETTTLPGEDGAQPGGAAAPQEPPADSPPGRPSPSPSPSPQPAAEPTPEPQPQPSPEPSPGPASPAAEPEPTPPADEPDGTPPPQS